MTEENKNGTNMPEMPEIPNVDDIKMPEETEVVTENTAAAETVVNETPTQIPTAQSIPTQQQATIPTQTIPPYQQPQQYVYAVEEKPSRGFAIASLVLGILGVICCCMNFFDIPFILLSLIFGIIGLSKNKGDGMAIAGIILSIVAAILVILMFVLAGIGNSADPAYMDQYYKMLESYGYDVNEFMY